MVLQGFEELLSEADEALKDCERTAVTSPWKCRCVWQPCRATKIKDMSGCVDKEHEKIRGGSMAAKLESRSGHDGQGKRHDGRSVIGEEQIQATSGSGSSMATDLACKIEVAGLRREVKKPNPWWSGAEDKSELDGRLVHQQCGGQSVECCIEPTRHGASKRFNENANSS
eukprot:Gb_32493 [translate_table: standard]